MPAKKRKYETPSGMHARGWTPTLIARFLGEPDELFDNPHYRSAAPMRAYLIERVQAAEGDPATAAALAKVLENRGKRAAAAKRAADTRRKRLNDWASSTPITWLKGTPTTEDEAREAGIEAWNAWQAECGRYDADGQSADRVHHNRWAENYLRHECIDYEAALAELHGECGKDEAYHVLRGRVDEMIRERFPTLHSLPERPAPSYPRESWDENLEKAMAQTLKDQPYHRYRAAREDGAYSVQAFREDVLAPRLVEAIKENKKLVVNLDGRKYRYPLSWLHSAFTKLVYDLGPAAAEHLVLEGTDWTATEALKAPLIIPPAERSR